jgi:hypothetical protein
MVQYVFSILVRGQWDYGFQVQGWLSIWSITRRQPARKEHKRQTSRVPSNKKTCDWKVLSTRYPILNITYVTTTTTRRRMMMMMKRHCKTYHRTGTPSRNAARTNAKSCRTHKTAPGRSTEHVPTSGIRRISTIYNPPISANDCNISIGMTDRWLL